MAADADDLEGAATTVVSDTDIMEEITRIIMEVLNKVKAIDIIIMNKDTIRSSNTSKLGHHTKSKGNPTTTWGQPGTTAIPLQCRPVIMRVCASQGCIIETTSLRTPAIQFQARTSSLK